MEAVVYEADRLWDGETLRAGVLAVGEDGRVAAPDSLPAARRIRLPGRALLPGLVNAHSHAFQRLLRGRTEHRAANGPASPGGPPDDFWTWRERMYRAAERLTPEGLHAAARQAFLEMALAGMTTVGEFHYLHHDPAGAPYAEGALLARAVIRAAREVGLRIVLLRVGYARAGFQKAPDPRQRRFLDASPEAWLNAATELQTDARADPCVTVGLAPHSVRALPRGWLEALAAARTPLPIHMHVAEQPAEVDACVAEHGVRPVELLASLGLLSPGFTAVHAVHVTPEEMARLGRARAGVCACPSTERNLGDGVVPADGLLGAGVALSLGSDSQVQVDLIDEARQLEGHLRLTHRRRNVLDPGTGAPEGLGARLLSIATRGGARALGLPTGSLAVGSPADFFTVDLDHPSLVGASPDALLGTLVAGGSSAAVREVAVNGRLIVQNGDHPLREQAGRDFASVLKEVFG